MTTRPGLDFELRAIQGAFDQRIRASATVVDREMGRMNRAAAKVDGVLGKFGERVASIPFGRLAAGATAAAGGVLFLVRRATQAAEDIQDMANRAGIGAEALQELRFAFTQNGAAVGDVDRALVQFNRRLGDFIGSGGAGDAAEGMRRIGIGSVDAARALGGTEAAFDAVIGRLAAIKGEQERVAATSRLFGEEAGPKLAVLIGQGTGAVDELRQRAREMGAVLGNEAVARAAELNAEMRALGQTVSTQVTAALIRLAPEIREIAERFADSLPTIIAWGERVAEVFGFIGASLDQQLADNAARVMELRRQLEAGGGANPWLDEQRQKEINRLMGEQAEIMARMARIEDARATARAGPPPASGVSFSAPGAGSGARASAPSTPFDDALAGARDENAIAARRATIAAIADDEERVRVTRALEIELMEVALAERLRAEAVRQNTAEGRANTEVTWEQEQAIAEVTARAGDLARGMDAITAAQDAQQASAARTEQALQGIANAFTAGIQQADSFEDSLKRVAVNLLNIGLQGALGVGPLGGAVNTGLGVESGGLIGTLFNANGNAFAGGRVIPFARGGVVSSPTTFPMAGRNLGVMGEAGPEAIMPLKRGPGGRLGVEASGGGGVAVHNTYHFAPGVQASDLRAEGERIKRETIAAISAARRENSRFLA